MNLQEKINWKNSTGTVKGKKDIRVEFKIKTKKNIKKQWNENDS